jgi:hypothetical protein
MRDSHEEIAKKPLPTLTSYWDFLRQSHYGHYATLSQGKYHMSSLKWLAVCAAVAVTGCAQAPKKQAFNREQAGTIQTVSITQTDKVEFYEAGMLGHPGASFGLIGGLIAAADTQSKSTRLTSTLLPAETQLQKRLSEKLKTGLDTVGYKTQIMAIAPDIAEDKLVETVSKTAATDTVLAVSVVGKYLAAGPNSDYFPFLSVKARKFEVKTGKMLYEDTFTYGYTFPNSQTVHFASDAKYRFANIDALVADASKTRQGLIDGLDLIVTQITADLKKN